MLRSAVLHFYDTLSMRAPSICTVVALTWIRALRGVEIKKEPSLGAAKRHKKALHNPAAYRLGCGPNGGICVCIKLRCTCIRAIESVSGCVHLCKCSVFAKGEGFWAFKLFISKDPTCPFQSLSAHRSWYIIEKLFLKKTDHRGSLIHPLHGQLH